MLACAAMLVFLMRRQRSEFLSALGEWRRDEQMQDLRRGQDWIEDGIHALEGEVQALANRVHELGANAGDQADHWTRDIFYGAWI